VATPAGSLLTLKKWPTQEPLVIGKTDEERAS
jgi:hypothetical protein